MLLPLFACQAPEAGPELHDPTGSAPSTPVATRDGWPILPQLDALAVDVLADADVPGASAALVHGGAVVWAGAWGIVDLDDGRPVRADTPFMLASVSKTITAVALMQVRDETGAFGLDDDVNDVLPFPVVSPAPVTCRHLMTHTSGLLDDWDVFDQNYVEGDATIPLETYLRDYLTPGGQWYADGHYAPWAPGDRYVYSNIGAALLGELVEAATDAPFDAWCDAHVFSPLGMTRTGWHLADLDPAEVASPHIWRAGVLAPVPHYGYPDYPDGQLRSSAEDLGRFLAAFAGGGTLDGVRILAASSVDEMKTEQDAAVAPGQGLIWYTSDFGGGPMWGHSGSDWGVATQVLVDDHGDGFVLLMNATPTDWYAIGALEYGLVHAAETWAPQPLPR